MTWPAKMSARDVEIAEERAAIIAEACKIPQDEAELRVVAIWENRKRSKDASVGCSQRPVKSPD